MKYAIVYRTEKRKRGLIVFETKGKAETALTLLNKLNDESDDGNYYDDLIYILDEGIDCIPYMNYQTFPEILENVRFTKREGIGCIRQVDDIEIINCKKPIKLYYMDEAN
jgi:hypothetical protein